MTTIQHENNEPMFGNAPLVVLAQKTTFTGMLYQALTGAIPTAQEEELFGLCLKLSIDHGPDTPSAKVTIAMAKEGALMGESVGAGISKIDHVHGGAIEPAMHMFYEVAKTKNCGRNIVANFETHKKRIPGFGHRIYEKDPRATFILDTIERLGFQSAYINYAREIDEELRNTLPNKTIPLNIDGAIAVALCTLGWKPEWSTGVFITARSAGLCAHYLEHRDPKTGSK